MISENAVIRWTEGGEERTARWRSESGVPPAHRVVVVDDRVPADIAYGLACQGTALLWRGDFQNARQMLNALAARVDKPQRKAKTAARRAEEDASSGNRFHLYRQARSQRARTLGALLVPLDERYAIPLRRAPDIREACVEAYGPPGERSLVSLREVLGLIGAHEWRRTGIDVPVAGGRIHPHYGVFAPVRSEYVDLVAKARLPRALADGGVAFDIGTGTGVLAAVLAKRGVRRVVATDIDPRALACARENLARLGLSQQVEVVAADLFPAGRAVLAVCNPPWVPARPSSTLERGIYDEESRMLRGFITALPAHLEMAGEGWLILSDLAEHLGMRSRAELLASFTTAGLEVADRLDARPQHPRVADTADPLHAARAAEVTSLWRLVPVRTAGPGGSTRVSAE